MTALVALLKGLIGELPGDLFYDLAKQGIKKFYGSITDADVKSLRIKMGAPMPLEDERIFKQALARLQATPGDPHTVVLSRLAALAPLGSGVNNLYRLIIVGEANPAEADVTIDEARRIGVAYDLLLADSNLNDAEWEQQVAALGIRDSKIDAIREALTKAGKSAQSVLTTLSASIEAETSMMATTDDLLARAKRWADSR